jgi:alpha-L-fucosidase 2
MMLAEPAERWDFAMPTSNGQVAAMVFGNIANEIVVLNHDSLFIRSIKPVLPDVSHHLPKLREMLEQRQYNQAQAFIENEVDRLYDYRGPDPYHPAFNITVDMLAVKGATSQRRAVNFETGEVEVSWKQGDVRFERRLFISRKDDVVVMRIRASKPGKVNCNVGLLPTGLRRDELGDGKNVRIPRFPRDEVKYKIFLDKVPITFNLTASQKLLTISGKYDVGGEWKMVGGNEFGGCARVLVKGGGASESELQAHVNGADEVLVLCKLFANEDSDISIKRLTSELKKLPADYDTLLVRHNAVHRELFLRATLDLGGQEKYRSMTNEELLAEIAKGRGSNALMERLFDFGRFTLICSSRPGAKPANLKGIWCGVYGPAWSANYHNDINIQMSYFQALPGNMAEVTLPYVDLYEEFIDDFRTNAKNMYGCRGIMLPISGLTTHGLMYKNVRTIQLFSNWTAGASWIAQLFYDYWLYTGNRKFLRERAVPFMKECALFYEDFLFEGYDGKYVFSPSYSPENTPANTQSAWHINATMDIAVCKEVLSNLVRACEELGIEKEGVKRWRKMLAKLPDYMINEDGALKEWVHPELRDNYGHRHLSHLYPLFPGLELSGERRPELFEACRQAMEQKFHGEGLVSFTCALKACVYSRLGEGEAALRELEILAKSRYMLPNLSTLVGTGYPVMQMETSSGVSGAILEMLLYSEPGLIKLLPALPKAWANGHMKGLRARGGFEVDIDWRDGKLTKAVIRSLLGKSCKIRYAGKTVELKTEAGKGYHFDGGLKLSKADKAAVDSRTGSVGRSLRRSVVWVPLQDEQLGEGTRAAFRRKFVIREEPARAQLHIFADARYVLWVNGDYVLRGPCRFNPKRPEYDTVDVQQFLKTGSNTVAVLAVGGITISRAMKHEPGLAVRLEVLDRKGGRTTLVTDKSWRCSKRTKYLPPRGKGSCVQDNIDATREEVDWVLPEFDDSAWSLAMNVDGTKWGAFYPRSIPLLRETEVGPASIVQVKQGYRTDNTTQALPEALPVDMRAPAEMVIDMGRLAQAYWVLDFEADKGSEFTVRPCQTFSGKKKAENNFGKVNAYKARAGRQKYMSTDTFGFRYMHLQVNWGRIRLLGTKFVDVTYPFDRLGRFYCSDPMLNELWDRATYTVQVCSEDAYVDCALRERAEWMGDGAVVTYPISRVAFASPGDNGSYTYADPRLIRNMLRHISLSQWEDGRIKANTCSDGGDMHSYIEDYACLWVETLRQYYDNTGDADFVREVWPVLTKQMNWFLDRRTQRQLVRAREFLLHMDNPLHHQEDCEGATLNAFIYKALVDSAYLAEVLGKKQKTGEYADAAANLARAFNEHLWDEASQTYYAGIKEGKKIPPNRWKNKVSDAYWARVTGAKEFPPTVHAAMLALNKGIVPDDRLGSVRKYVAAHAGELNNPYTHFFLFEELYKTGTDPTDLQVLEIMRRRWAPMIDKKDPGTLIEKFEFGEGGSSCHNFGSVPAYFLSAYVLGVRTAGPVWNKRIIIEPRLGDLQSAEGVVVTEHGLVPVSWKRTGSNRALIFRFEVPADVRARVSIPRVSRNPTLIINGKTAVDKGRATGALQLRSRFVTLELDPGRYSGNITQ